MSSLDFVFLHPYWAIPLALLPAGFHWWWTRAVLTRSESAVLPERHLATVQRVSAVTMLCTIAIVTLAGWAAIWILPLQFLALTSSNYRVRRVLFAETWPFRRYLAWRARLSTGMFGLWWFVALIPLAVADASPQVGPWLAVLTVVIALTWHHWNGRVLLFLLGASRLERPDLDGHFAPVFAAARVPTPRLWRAGMEGGVLANAFALVTLDLRGVLFFDTLLQQLTPEEVTAILAHEVAHLEQFTRRRMLGIYAFTAVLIILLTAGSAAASVIAPGVEPWIGLISVVGVFLGIWLRARRMQVHETDADLRAIELCGNPEALIRGLTRIHEINHIPRRWALRVEERASHPSLARRIRTIRARASSSEAVATGPLERVIVASSAPGRCALIDHQRVAFLWIDGDISNAEGLIDRASRVEIIAFDQLSELRLTTNRAAIELIAADRHARRWSMPIHDSDAARLQAALDSVDHLVVAPTTKDLGIARRAAVLMVLLLAASFNAVGAVIVPGLLALRRPMRPMMMALVGALAGTAIASANDLDVSLVRIGVLAILALMVSWSIRRRPLEEPQPNSRLWARIEWVGLLIPAGIGLIIAVASSRDLFGLHAAVRDRAWVTASLAAVAAFFFVLSANRSSRRLGLSIAALATASFVVGSPWFLVNAVADPLVASMPAFTEKTATLTALSQRSVETSFSSVRLTPGGNAFVLFGQFDVPVESDDHDPAPRLRRFVAGGFDGWSREIAALDVAAIDDQRLLVLDRDARVSRLRAEDLRTGAVLWTTTLENPNVVSVQASTDGRWRALARLGKDFEQFDGQIGASLINSTRWLVAADDKSYLDAPRIDGGPVALGVAPQWEEPTLAWLVADFRETTRILRIDSAQTTVLATSHLSVECPAPPLGVTGYVCVSLDGRSSRFWRVDTSSGRLMPIAETSRVIWRPSQVSEQRLVGVASGRPTLVDLDSQTIVTLIRDTPCWTQDVAVARAVMVATCTDGRGTTVMQYQLPIDSY